jgi:hypothetical protein
MTQNTKTILIYAGALLVGSGLAYAIYSANKNKLPLVDGAKVTDDKQKTVAEETTDSKSRSNYFASLLQNPLPKDIDYKFGSTTKL